MSWIPSSQAAIVSDWPDLYNLETNCKSERPPTTNWRLPTLVQKCVCVRETDVIIVLMKVLKKKQSGALQLVWSPLAPHAKGVFWSVLFILSESEWVQSIQPQGLIHWIIFGLTGRIERLNYMLGAFRFNHSGLVATWAGGYISDRKMGWMEKVIFLFPMK